MPVYATADQYVEYTGTSAPADIDPRLARASARIDELLRTAVYPIDNDTQMPTEADHIDAFMRATCEQVAWMKATGDEYGVAAAFKDIAIGSVKLSRSGSSDSGPPRYAPDAVSILQLAGLLPGYVIDVGGW